MTARPPRHDRGARGRLLAASASLGVVAVLGTVPAAHADSTDTGAAGADAARTAGADRADAAKAQDGDAGAADDETGAAPATGPGDEAGSDTPTAEPTGAPADGPTDQPTEQPTDQPVDETGDPSSGGPTTGAHPGDGAGDAGAVAQPGPSATAAVPSSPVRGATSPLVVPDFGDGKYRVGVKIADGSYVPPGTTTAGTVLTATFSDGTTDTCTTAAPDTTGTSYCADEVTGPAGGTVTVTQGAPRPGLAAAPARTVEGCTIADDSPIPFCSGADIVLEAPGTPPTAAPDAATTASGRSVDVDVLANDDDGNGAPLTGTEVSSGPSHGSATFTASGGGSGTAAIVGGPVVRYVPQAGFSGIDRFTYTISTANGSASAQVSVRVEAAAGPSGPQSGGTPTRTQSTRSTRVASSTVPVAAASGPLPDTGGPSLALLGLGAGLVAGGGVVTVTARRRSQA